LLLLLVFGLWIGEYIDKCLLVLAFLFKGTQVIKGVCKVALRDGWSHANIVLKNVKQVPILLLLFFFSSTVLLKKDIATALLVPRHTALRVLINWWKVSLAYEVHQIKVGIWLRLWVDKRRLSASDAVQLEPNLILHIAVEVYFVVVVHDARLA
jgi:hypothetical protein